MVLQAPTLKYTLTFMVAILLLGMIVQVQSLNLGTTIRSSGTITLDGSVSPGFTFRGTTLTIKAFFPGYADYKPNVFEVLKDLGIDTIRVYGAGFEEFNMLSNPDGWATELKAFLDLLGNNGVKVVFHEMADWRYLNSDTHPHARRTTRNPWPFGIALYDGIASSKAKIDALAGVNSIGYNFLTDPRIPFWILLNEPFLDTSTDSGVNVLDWVKQIADYMRSKGAKVTVGHPSIQHGVYTPSLVLPLYRDRIDYVIFHWYDAGTYSYIYSGLTSLINTYKPELGSIPVQNLMIGEIGFERSWSGVTEQIMGDTYKAYFQASLDAGLGAIFPYVLYDLKNSAETWGAIDSDGNYITAITDQYKAYYSAT